VHAFLSKRLIHASSFVFDIGSSDRLFFLIALAKPVTLIVSAGTAAQFKFS
jgi:hypothetical protein